jgi:hypothetical protein
MSISGTIGSAVIAGGGYMMAGVAVSAQYLGGPIDFVKWPAVMRDEA